MTSFSSKKAQRKWNELMQETILGLRLNTEKILRELKTDHHSYGSHNRRPE